MVFGERTRRARRHLSPTTSRTCRRVDSTAALVVHGGHQDPRHQGKHPELKDKVIVPDVLLQPHNASLEFAFYEGQQFPAEYKGDIFASEHGSWNKAVRVGYEVIRVPLHQKGDASGDYEDFLTGLYCRWHVWGRPWA